MRHEYVFDFGPLASATDASCTLDIWRRKNGKLYLNVKLRKYVFTRQFG